MKTIQHLSPTGLKTFGEDKVEFYRVYLSDFRPPRIKQTKQMAVGSAFDAFAKSFLYSRLVGKTDPAYGLDALFEKQVEPHNRDEALRVGKQVFDSYIGTGAMSALMLELKTGSHLSFEFEVKQTVKSVYGEATLLGRPDIFFINDQGARVVYDWKVNGFYSAASPNKMYVRILPGGDTHKAVYPVTEKGLRISNHPMEDTNLEWATQLSTYAWLLGEAVGSDEWFAGIDQLAYRNGDLRVASFRNRVGAMYQRQLFERYVDLWKLCHSGHYFNELSYEESRARCQQLDAENKALIGDGSSEDAWFNEQVRGYD